MITKQIYIKGYIWAFALLFAVPVASAETSTNYQIDDIGVAPMTSNSYTLQQDNNAFVAKPGASQNYQIVTGTATSSAVSSTQSSSTGGGQTSTPSNGGSGTRPPAQSSTPQTPTSSSSRASSIVSQPSVPESSSSSSVHPAAPSSESSSSLSSSDSSDSSVQSGSGTTMPPSISQMSSSSSSEPCGYTVVHLAAQPRDPFKHILPGLSALLVINAAGLLYIPHAIKRQRKMHKKKSSRSRQALS